MAAMAIQVAVAQVSVASLAPITAHLGGPLREKSRRVAVGLRDHTVQRATEAGAVVGMWKRTQNRTVLVRAEAGGEGSTATATTTTPTAAPGVEAGGITEVNKDTFWPIVKSAGEKVVVLDMYTQWCGPCKLILPKIKALAATMDDVIFCKLDCNQENKPLAKELGIRAVPTFKIFKAGELVTTITGAKYDILVAAIESARKGQ